MGRFRTLADRRFEEVGGRKMKYDVIQNSVAWIVTAAAVIAGVYFTKDIGCLWAFAFPLIFCS